MSARLIEHIDAPFSGAMNMAIDQVLLETACDVGAPTLRLYTWKEPTISLGYFQEIEARKKHQPSESLPLVRRSTGGGAIVHHHELTYSLILPFGKGTHGANTAVYGAVHASIIACLGTQGHRAQLFKDTGHAPDDEAFLCFGRRTAEDLITSGYKVTGSAQRRYRGSLLQHGSILLRTSQHAPSLPGVECLTGKRFDLGKFCQELTQSLEKSMDISLLPTVIPSEDLAAASDLASCRFRHDGWNARR